MWKFLANVTPENRKMLSEGLVVSSQCQEMKFRDATLLAISEIALCSTLSYKKSYSSKDELKQVL